MCRNWCLFIRLPKLSVRKLAKEFGISKSQVHRDLHRLRTLNHDLYVQCMSILNRHKRRY